MTLADIKKKIFPVIMPLLALLLVSCSGRSGKNNNTATARAAGFPYPEIPSYINGEDAVREYAAVHFWDIFFGSPQDYCRRQVMEEAFANYAATLSAAAPQARTKAQERLLRMADKCHSEWPEGGVLEFILASCDSFFNDPNSPFRDEECYLPVVDYILESESVEEASKARAAHLKPLLSLNRPSEVANDFTYTLKNGRKGTLHGIKADKTLLFFSNPGCTNCKEITEALSGSSAVTELISTGKLRILNVYPDADLTEWYNYISHYPEEWIVGFDAEGILNGNTIYYLRAIPSLYLLDADKRVILKDAPLERILESL